MSKVLVVIDIQNDYFEGGKFPLVNTVETTNNIVKAIEKANANNIPVVNIQHVDTSSPKDMAPFTEGTEGVKIRPEILTVTPNAKVVTKAHADGFYNTDLETVLDELGATELLICGMMTQNCVTHTAISKTAEKYNIKILPECCTTVNEMIHMIALEAIRTRIELVSYEEALI